MSPDRLAETDSERTGLPAKDKAFSPSTERNPLVL